MNQRSMVADLERPALEQELRPEEPEKQVEQEDAQTEKTESAVLTLQRTAGNAAVSRLLAARRDPVPSSDSGEPLDLETKRYMEASFGHDFSDVRVHTGSEAEELAEAHNADAYTTGEDVVFARGVYAPGTPSGRRLIAHELAHVVQQRLAGEVTTGVGEKEDPLESAADVAAEAATGDGATPPPAVLTPPGAPNPPAAPPATGQDAAAADARGFGAAAFALATVGGGSPLSVQRQESAHSHVSPSDDLQASMIEALYSTPDLDDTAVLIDSGTHLQKLFRASEEEPVRPRTRIVAAQALLGIIRVLRERERVSLRDANGVLLRKRWLETLPWTPAEPKRLADIEPFSPDNVAAWRAAALLAKPRTGSGRQRRQSTSAATSPAAKEETEGFSEEPPTLIASSVEAEEFQQPAVVQHAVDAREIHQGLAKLHRASVATATEAVRAFSDERADDPQTAKAKSFKTASSNVSLLGASAFILYVANNIYVLDRTAHISGMWRFGLAGISMRPGTYFLGPFVIGVEGSKSSVPSKVLLNLDGPQPRVSGGDIFPRTVNQDLLPLLEMTSKTLRARRGVAIIISPSFNGKEEKSKEPALDKIQKAFLGSSSYFEWALDERLTHLKESWDKELRDMALGMAIGQLAKLMPPVAVGMAMYHAITAITEIAELAQIASDARSDDEIELVSQAVARGIVSVVSGKIIGLGIGMASGGVRRLAMRSGGTPSPQPPAAPKGTAEPTPRPQAATTPPSTPAPAAPRALPSPQRGRADIPGRGKADVPDRNLRREAAQDAAQQREAARMQKTEAAATPPPQQAAATAPAAQPAMAAAAPQTAAAPAPQAAPPQQPATASAGAPAAAASAPSPAAPAQAPAQPAMAGATAPAQQAPAGGSALGGGGAAPSAKAPSTPAAPAAPPPAAGGGGPGGGGPQGDGVPTVGTLAPTGQVITPATSTPQTTSPATKTPSAQPTASVKQAPAVAQTPAVQPAAPSAAQPTPAAQPMAQAPAVQPAAQTPAQAQAQARRRNAYPDFEAVAPGVQPTIAAQAQTLSQQLGGLNIPENRVLSAPWIGRIRSSKGTTRSASTSMGYLRNEGRFWAEFQRRFPQDYALLGPGRTVTAAFAQRYGWPASTVGQKLIHHHMENGSFTVAIPENLHHSLSGAIHARPTVEAEP